MQNAKHAHQIFSYIINQNVVLMGDKLAGALDTPLATKAGMVNKPRSLFGNQFIERQRGSRVVLSDVFANFPAVAAGGPGPDQPHESAPESLRRISERQGAAPASPTSAGANFPAAAASGPAPASPHEPAPQRQRR